MTQPTVEAYFSELTNRDAADSMKRIRFVQQFVEPTKGFWSLCKATKTALQTAGDETEQDNCMINALLYAITIGRELALAEAQTEKLEEMFK